MRARRILAAVAAVLALAFGWRWAQLRRAVEANRQALAAAVRGADPAGVALAVHANEARFEATLRLAAARRTAGWLCLTCAGAALVLGAPIGRRSRGPIPRS